MKTILAFLTFFLLLYLFLAPSPTTSLFIIQEKLRGNIMQSKPLLPKTVGIWTESESPKLIDAKNIFDYMDGAGELYLAYRFDHLEASEYRAETQKDILVELYFMKTSDDAFGLLSMDWGGEPLNLSGRAPENVSIKNLDWPRALYGEGLLRIWSDNIYARVMAYQETSESKQAVLELGRAIVRNRRNPPAPELMNALPHTILQNWKLRRDRAGYFRSHLVLNALYYLGHENMLDLNHSTEAVTAPYDQQNPPGNQARTQLLMIIYPNADHANQALAHFHQVYLPDYPPDSLSLSKGGLINIFPIEDGWLGYRFHKNSLSIVFECPEKETAEKIITRWK